MTDFKAKMHQIDFGWGSAPNPTRVAYSAPQNPIGFGAASRQGEGLCWGRRGKGDGKGREGEVEGRERAGPKLQLNQGPQSLDTPLIAVGYRLDVCVAAAVELVAGLFRIG